MRNYLEYNSETKILNIRKKFRNSEDFMTRTKIHSCGIWERKEKLKQRQSQRNNELIKDTRPRCKFTIYMKQMEEKYFHTDRNAGKRKKRNKENERWTLAKEIKQSTLKRISVRPKIPYSLVDTWIQ